ncbi:MAG: PepSY domain-containing protein [Methanobacterium sp.]|uniref:hypothetical protein n=1 Tax=Methanobacterium sp. TaxID=2164 RepID=UPI003D6564C3|nr:PepSY domain-containing protein [Methanobacterium sp.]
MNKGIIAIIAVIILAGVGLYVYSLQGSNINTGNNTTQNITNPNNTQTTPQNQTNITSVNNTQVNNNIKTNISSEHAKEISLQFINEPGAYPGNPTLSKLPDGKLVWDIPVIQNGKIVSGVVIDAQTGANLGEGQI